MLSWVFIFLVLSIVAGLLGFTGLMETSAEIAEIIFFIFLVLFGGSLILHLIRRSNLP